MLAIIVASREQALHSRHIVYNVVQGRMKNTRTRKALAMRWVRVNKWRARHDMT
jgi:hypothetical protein